MWRDTDDVFSTRERVALAWAETVTRVAETGRMPPPGSQSFAASCADRRRDRAEHSSRCGRCDRLSGQEGGLSPRRRRSDVHSVGAVDAGAEIARTIGLARGLPAVRRDEFYFPSLPGPQHPTVVTRPTRRGHPAAAGDRLVEPLCVPKTLSELMEQWNLVSWRNDRAALFRSGRPGLAIQVEVAA